VTRPSLGSFPCSFVFSFELLGVQWHIHFVFTRTAGLSLLFCDSCVTWVGSLLICLLFGVSGCVAPHQFTCDIGLTLDLLDKHVGVRVSRNAMIFLIFFRVSDQSGRAVRTCTDRKSPPRPPGCDVLTLRPNRQT
jgi:hypothetical protein